MKKLQLVSADNPILRQEAEPIPRITGVHRRLCEAMLQFLYDRPHAAGLAAPQIGIPKRIIVMKVGPGGMALINPRILDPSEERSVLVEGCLSLPGVQVPVARPISCTITGLMPHGSRFSADLTDVLAKVAQHEVDHLNGILITDYATPDPETE